MGLGLRRNFVTQWPSEQPYQVLNWINDPLYSTQRRPSWRVLAFKMKRVTRGHNIVADGWARASNPHPHPNPAHTLKHTQKVFKNAHFSTFWLLIHGQTDRLKDGPTDQWMDKSSLRVACLQLQSRRRWIQHERTITSHPLYRRISVTPESVIAGCNYIFFSRVLLCPFVHQPVRPLVGQSTFLLFWRYWAIELTAPAQIWPNTLVIFSFTAHAHSHATGVAVYPALLKENTIE